MLGLGTWVVLLHDDGLYPEFQKGMLGCINELEYYHDDETEEVERYGVTIFDEQGHDIGSTFYYPEEFLPIKLKVPLQYVKN
jgi:hypothetical protein